MPKLPFLKNRTQSPIVDEVIPAHIECEGFSVIEFTVRGRHFTKDAEVHALGQATCYSTEYVSAEELRGRCDVYATEREPESLIGLMVINDPKSFSEGCSNRYPIAVTFSERREEEPAERKCDIPF